jgi:hypothetical protein
MNSQHAPINARPASRAQALRRSLLESLPQTEDAPVLPVRASRFAGSFEPHNDFQTWLVAQVAELTLRVERCGQSERRLRERASLRAEVCWDHDRARQAEAIGAKLAARPAEVVEQLRGTAAGCAWLIRRWALLARSADLAGFWTEDQNKLAFDLLATPPEFRTGTPGESIDDQGLVVEPSEGPAAVARRQIAGLVERRDRLAGLDEVDRALMMADLFDDPNPEIARLRRHEASLQRRIQWCIGQLGRASKVSNEVQPDWLAEAPTVPARPSRPPLEWELPEFPEVDIDPIALQESRRELREQVADLQRQEARRLERLPA